MNRLQDKVAIVTGGGSGIGFATSHLFAEEGARVVIFDINDSHADLGLYTLSEHSLHVDVTSPLEVESALKNVTDRYGRIDILVNVAGGSGRRWGDGPANVICPSLIATPMSQRAQESEHIRARLSQLQPLTGDFGSPNDVAQAALYLASEESSFVTGSVLTVIGSYPFPSWLELASQQLDKFGTNEIAELQEDAVTIAIHDQVEAGLDVITDGEQSRLDFNLSFYGYLQGIQPYERPLRVFGPPAHDQRGKHNIAGEISAPGGLGVVEEYERLKRLAPKGFMLKASVPGPYTLSGRLNPNEQYPDRYAVTEALIPIVCTELEALVKAGCKEITVDEPSMSCYAYKEDTKRFVDIFNRTVGTVFGKTHLSTHLCFGNFKARAVGPRQYAPMFPDFLDMKVYEIHLEMASREFSELEIIEEIAKVKDVAVGIVDVKSYYIETPEDIASRVRYCLKYAPPERLSFAPDCGLSQTARWAAKLKLQNMVKGVKIVREELGISESNVS